MSKIRQKRVLAKMAENGGNMSRAMRESGYSDEYSSSPHKLARTKSFQEILEQTFPDDYLLEKHRELMEKKVKGQPETLARKAALELAYKLKGSFAAEKKSHEFPKGVPILPLDFIENDDVRDNNSDEEASEPSEEN